jgi:predicted metal-dependent hydrolase
MASQFRLGDIAVDVVLKDIKNIHLSVYPPHGHVRMSAPARLPLDTLRVYALSKLGWIRQQQKKLRAQERESPREYLKRESHYVWGTRYLLDVREEKGRPRVDLRHRRMVVRVRPGTTSRQVHALVERWYRQQVRDALPALLARWEPLLGVKAGRVFIQRMKTRWGSCSRTGSIRLNTDLAKKPPECLEYLVVHELIHLLEPTHNARFQAMLDRALPQWRFRRQQLNRLPVRHEEWSY